MAKPITSLESKPDTIQPELFCIAIEPALLALPCEPEKGRECLELTVGSDKRYLSRTNFPRLREALAERLDSPWLGLVAARRLVALARLLIKPHFVGRVARMIGVNRKQAFTLLFYAAAEAPFEDEWSFKPLGFAEALRSAAAPALKPAS